MIRRKKYFVFFWFLSKNKLFTVILCWDQIILLEYYKGDNVIFTHKRTRRRSLSYGSMEACKVVHSNDDILFLVLLQNRDMFSHCYDMTMLFFNAYFLIFLTHYFFLPSYLWMLYYSTTHYFSCIGHLLACRDIASLVGIKKLVLNYVPGTIELHFYIKENYVEWPFAVVVVRLHIRRMIFN